jgi:phosphotransferase system enzyme I (PtsI)
MDKDKILSFVTVHGSANSHTSILAKTMSIPAIIGCDIPLTDEMDGREAIVDGFEGKVYVDPEPEVLAEKKKIVEREQEKKELLEQLRGKENITQDGQKINLYANIGNTKDLGLVLKNDAGGIGLFRSEFIYLGSQDYPTEEEQFEIYKTIAQTMAGKKVIIRTLDIGADKQADYFALPKEENPAMGLRAIRICLTRPEGFKTKLRAILRASAFGKIAIMFPMIISLEEVKEIKGIVNEVKTELDDAGISYDKNIELGIMIETPAAVMVADELAEEVDFFSVGTNDLTQYTLAIDRQNDSLEKFYNSHHPAILKMLKMIVDAAHRHGAWAGICGELGADLTLTKDFLAMGFDELSVSPRRILPLRKIVLETDVSEYKKSLNEANP